MKANKNYIISIVALFFIISGCKKEDCDYCNAILGKWECIGYEYGDMIDVIEPDGSYDEYLSGRIWHRYNSSTGTFRSAKYKIDNDFLYLFFEAGRYDQWEIEFVDNLLRLTHIYSSYSTHPSLTTTNIYQPIK